MPRTLTSRPVPLSAAVAIVVAAVLGMPAPALRLLGARVRNYDGSWMEWANSPALPVER
jgi:3-mercaptopyruvate sulfurtransferase SseA